MKLTATIKRLEKAGFETVEIYEGAFEARKQNEKRYIRFDYPNFDYFLVADDDGYCSYPKNLKHAIGRINA